MKRHVREVILIGSVVALVTCAAHGWAWPTIGALAVLTGALLVVTEGPARVARCRVCGCTDRRACWPVICWWVEPDLCSTCAPKAATR